MHSHNYYSYSCVNLFNDLSSSRVAFSFLPTMTSLVYDLTMYCVNCKLISVKKVWMIYYVIIDLRYLYERNTQNEDVETNPFNLADIK